MAVIVQLSAVREQAAVRDGYRLWRKRFGQDFSINTRIPDFEKDTLHRLARSGDERTSLLNALIIGFSGYGGKTRFEELESGQKKHIVDLYLFLSDQLYFEIMCRLGWLENYPGRRLSLYRLVADYPQINTSWLENPPVLASRHTMYAEYKDLTDRDKQVFIRRLLPAALESFRDLCQIR